MACFTSRGRFDSQYKKELETLLEEFYQTFAKPKAIPEKDLDYFKGTVAEVLKKVMEKQPRFNFVPHDVGSVASGDAAVVPCDLDILLCLDVEGSEEESELSPGYAKFKLSPSSAKVWQDVANDHYLHPGKITASLRSLVKDVVAEMKLEETFHVGGEFSAAVALKMLRGSYMLKADLVLAVKRSGWPRSANQMWREFSVRHLPSSATTSSSILETLSPESCVSTCVVNKQKDEDLLSKQPPATLMGYGYDMVANRISEQNRGVNDTGVDRDVLWRLSMSRVETLLLRSVSQFRENERKCLVIFKAIRLYELAKQDGFRTPSRGYRDSVSYLLTSYHLKTLFLHNAFNFSAQTSTHCELVDCFLSFLDTLNSTYNISVFGMPSFFFPKTNVFPHGTTRNEFISKLHNDPLAYFRSVLPIEPSVAFTISFY